MIVKYFSFAISFRSSLQAGGLEISLFSFFRFTLFGNGDLCFVHQNVILHSRLEALHIKFAERERGLAGNSSSNVDQDFSGDAGLQNVVKYLRRSKEIVRVAPNSC